MKKIFRKAMTVLGSAALVGATMGSAFAASYPSPFSSNTAVVVGTGSGVAASDGLAASDIVSDLTALSAASSVVSTGSITGDSKSLTSGSDLLYLNDEFNENVQTLTKSDLPTVLADGTFTDDDGTDFDYEQSLVIGSSAGFAFSNSDNDLDDPALILALSDTAGLTSGLYDLTVTFNKAVPFNATNSEGQELTLFGKTYTVGTATDGDTLVLLGGSEGANINVGDTADMEVDGEPYAVTLNGLSSAATTQASITVNGDTKTFTQGQTKTVGGVDVYVKTVFRTGDTGEGYVTVQLGAGKMTLESGNAVQIGSDNQDIEGTLVTITGGVNEMTKLQITIAAPDNDANDLLVGESFVDPVFGTTLLKFEGVENGPTFSDEKDVGRTDMEIQKGGNRELQLSITDNAGNSATLPFTFNGALSDDNSKTINVVEGAYLADDEYFILNSGNEQHFMQITKVNTDESANSDVAMKDLLSGTSYAFDNHDFTSGYSATIAGQTYTITNVSATEVTVVSSDYGITNGKAVDVYPYLELVSGEDTRVAMTDNVVALDEFITAAAKTVTLNLPTGTIDVTANATADVLTIGSTSFALADDVAIAVGDVYYNFSVADGTAANAVDISVAVNAVPSTGAGASETDPALLFVEDEDKSEATTTTKPAILIATTDSAGYSSVSAPVFTGTYDTETWDDTDMTGWLTNYGTYVWRDTSDSNQNFVGLSYGDAMMSADVVIAEGEVSTSTSTEPGVMTVNDDEVTSSYAKNLIVVGGSAINSVAADLLGGAYRSEEFTAMTGVGAGEALIESFASPYSDGKVALLVAGYNAADTTMATTYLLNEDVDTTVGTKLKVMSTTEATVVAE